ncbi:E3 ubiquitin-protein ligase TRIM39 [Trichomycterus rosablanca]|uniref:E3 ubiquitin-protein ligase TRIM39 n=1 Tax=Trichomycterus rosablanca TaxID=2290929 RepID=UPI002F35D6BC
MSLPNVLSEDNFSCSVCLGVFSNPVSIPCGHSFCMTCITSYWDDRGAPCLCPLCKVNFAGRPEVQINHTLRDITERFRLLAETPDVSPNPFVSSPRTGRSPFHRAISSVDSVEPLAPPKYEFGQRRISSIPFLRANQSSGPPCSKHGQSLKLFCKNDHVCICALCAQSEHNGHMVVQAEREMRIMKSHVGIVETEVLSLITEREMKVQEIQTSMGKIQGSSQQEAEGMVRMFRTMISDLERSQVDLLKVVEQGRATTELRSQTYIRELQLEIAELRRRSSSLTELAQSSDPFTFFQRLPTVGTQPVMKSWKDVTLTPDPTAASAMISVTQMMENMKNELSNLPQICVRAPPQSIAPPTSQTTNLQEYALDVTLDGKTAHPRLVISDDCKEVCCKDRMQPFTDTPARFNRVVCVLGNQSISSGRHYWEVKVNTKTDWDLGVVSRSSNRKGKIAVSPANGYWFLSLRKKAEYSIRTEPPTMLSLHPRPQKIGIYVDYEKGQVSFFNADIMALIHTYMATFIDTLHPFFSPCTNKSYKNEAPLIICSVRPPQ